MNAWFFDHLMLDGVMQRHFTNEIRSGRLSKDEALAIGAAVKAFLHSPEAGALRLDPVRAAAKIAFGRPRQDERNHAHH